MLNFIKYIYIYIYRYHPQSANNTKYRVYKGA